MSIGTLSRKGLRRALAAVLREALPDVELVKHIALDAVPQGIAERGMALEGFASRDDASRKRRNSHVLKRHTVSARYAKRLGHDVEDDRETAEDDVDRIERAIRNSTNALTSEYSCDTFDSDQDVDPSGEWIVYDLRFDVLCQFKLREPDAVPVALE